MDSEKLLNISWYIDTTAKEKNEPGICHSYMTSLATALNYINNKLDPVWLMGSSAFAFRIFINDVMCPSANSCFDLSAILPEAIEQSGYQAIYICRYWDEKEKEELKREEAYSAIIEGIDSGVPAIVWDISGVEWGLVIGYNIKKKFYYTLTYEGEYSNLPFKRLGRNGINILSVAIPGKPNQRSDFEVIINSLKAAVAHAEQKEWMEKPHYENGLAAYDLWASLFEKGAMILEAGKGDNINPEVWECADYYASNIYGARCYARDYLQSIANGNNLILKSVACYEKVSSLLKPVWEHFTEKKQIDAKILHSMSKSIKTAKASEEEGINYIKDYLKNFG